MLLLLALAAPQALAQEARYAAGVQLAVAKDLPDRVERTEGTEFRIGPGLVIPGRLVLMDGLLRLRAGLEIYRAEGSDRLSWEEEETSFYKQDQPARLGSTRLLIGPEVRVPTGPGSPVHPYLGVGLGPGRVRVSHTLGGVDAELLSAADEPVARSRQWVLAASAHGGLAVDLGPVAAELEAGYTVSFVPEAPLSNTISALQVRREAYGLDVFRLGLGLSVPF